ncbi:MAG: aminopeptidase P family N-terminal domain-containing protein, partial [Pseudomonadota bacterium]
MNLSDTGTAPDIFVPSPEAARAMAATKHLHFSPAEFAARQSAACAAMDDAGLDALVMFRQESMYYLTGYDTFGYVFFQCMLLTRDGRLVLVTRAPDLRQAHFTSVVDDVRVWRDGAGVEPALLLSDLLAEFGLTGGKVGVEWEAYGLTARNGRVVDQALAQSGYHVSDASLLVSRLRLKKSPAELAYAARAGELADAAWEAACARAGAGVSEADVLADMHAVIMRGGGDDPANEFIIGSGPGALMCRYFTGRR